MKGNVKKGKATFLPSILHAIRGGAFAFGVLAAGFAGSALVPSIGHAQEEGGEEEPAEPTINVNTADVKTLTTLPGISKDIALRIVAYREEKGWFGSERDMVRVKGVGRKQLKKLAGKLAFDIPESASGGADGGGGGEASGNLQRGGRMEFDARLVRGQTAGAGAVFLFERVPRPLPSMVKRRTSYLDDSVRGSLGASWVEKTEEEKRMAEASKRAAKEEAEAKKAGKDKSKGRTRPRRRGRRKKK